MQILNNAQKELFNKMLPLYGALLKQDKVSKVTGLSKNTLYRFREAGVGPKYKKLPSRGKNGTIVYPLHELVIYLTETNVQTL